MLFSCLGLGRGGKLHYATFSPYIFGHFASFISEFISRIAIFSWQTIVPMGNDRAATDSSEKEETSKVIFEMIDHKLICLKKNSSHLKINYELAPFSFQIASYQVRFALLNCAITAAFAHPKYHLLLFRIVVIMIFLGFRQGYSTFAYLPTVSAYSKL